MKRLIPVISIIIIISILINSSDKVVIPKEAIRFRVIANSDSYNDQKNKKQIAKALSTDIVETLKNANSINDARITLKKNVPNYEKNAQKEAEKNNYKESIHINYGNNYFPEKEYKGVKYKSGNYESLVVTLGKGEGKNFWCVLFPPLCLLEAEEEEKTEKIKYKSFVKEIIDKYF